MSDTNRSKPRRYNDFKIQPDGPAFGTLNSESQKINHEGLFDCCYTSPIAFFISIGLPLGCCIAQGWAVQKATSGNCCIGFGSCALVSTTLCIGYAMNRKKIYDKEQMSVVDCIVGLCCIPCGVAQDVHHATKSSNSNSYKKMP